MKILNFVKQNVTDSFTKIDDLVGRNLEISNSTDKNLKELRLELKEELNEYAVKVFLFLYISVNYQIFFVRLSR